MLFKDIINANNHRITEWNFGGKPDHDGWYRNYWLTIDQDTGIVEGYSELTNTEINRFDEDSRICFQRVDKFHARLTYAKLTTYHAHIKMWQSLKKWDKAKRLIEEAGEEMEKWVNENFPRVE